MMIGRAGSRAGWQPEVIRVPGFALPIFGIVADLKAADQNAALDARIAVNSFDSHARAADLVRTTPAPHGSLAPVASRRLRASRFVMEEW